MAVHLTLLLCQRMAQGIFDHSFKGNLSNTILSLIRRKAVKLPYFCGATFGVFLFQDPINHPAIMLHIPPPHRQPQPEHICLKAPSPGLDDAGQGHSNEEMYFASHVKRELVPGTTV